MHFYQWLLQKIDELPEIYKKGPIVIFESNDWSVSDGFARLDGILGSYVIDDSRLIQTNDHPDLSVKPRIIFYLGEHYAKCEIDVDVRYASGWYLEVTSCGEVKKSMMSWIS